MSVEKKSLGEATAVEAITKNNSIVVEVGGSIRRITLDKFMDSMNTGDQELLRQVAWGVPIKQSVQSSPAWGVVGNQAMWKQFKAKIGRYMLSADGSKAAKLMSTDSTVYADGTNVGTITGHVMFHAPRLYFRVVNDAVTNIPYLWMSEYPIGGHYFESSWIGAYPLVTVNNIGTSRPGYVPDNNKTISAFWALAQKNGAQFGLANYDHQRLMMMLNLSEYGNPNVQENIGYGCSGDDNTWNKVNALKTGATKSLGDACGAIDISATTGNAKSCRVSLFGIEDAWGLRTEMRQGLYFGNSNNTAQDGTEVFIYDGNRIPTADELATHPNGNYRKITRLTSDGWIQEEVICEYFDLIKSKSGGGSSSYWCDHFWSNSTGQLLGVGGVATGGWYCGLACVRANDAFSNANVGWGARLAYYGTPAIVEGKNM